MLTDANVDTIEREIAALKQLPPGSLSAGEAERLIFCGETLLAEVKKLRAAAPPTSAPVASTSNCGWPDGWRSDLDCFLAFFSAFGIDYHVGGYQRPSDSCIPGGVDWMHLGAQVEFVFDSAGRLLGWREFESLGTADDEMVIHLRDGGE